MWRWHHESWVHNWKTGKTSTQSVCPFISTVSEGSLRHARCYPFASSCNSRILFLFLHSGPWVINQNHVQTANYFMLWPLNNLFHNDFCLTVSRCLKITEKVSFNFVSKASYVYILSGQKLIKNAKNGPFWRVFENLNSVTRQDKNWWKMPKFKNSNATFWVIFKQCAGIWIL